jgi:hypothetical protein
VHAQHALELDRSVMAGAWMPKRRARAAHADQDRGRSTMVRTVTSCGSCCSMAIPSLFG